MFNPKVFDVFTHTLSLSRCNSNQCYSYTTHTYACCCLRCFPGKTSSKSKSKSDSTTLSAAAESLYGADIASAAARHDQLAKVGAWQCESVDLLFDSLLILLVGDDDHGD
jgi:hypothetical protein